MSRSPSPSIASLTLPTPSPSHNLTNYSIGRGEHLVLTHEPYKSFILPHWRFRTVALATTSAASIYALFLRFYDETRDFVGMDMCRKFLQMGMTRAKRYANFKGGRKYDYDGDGGGGRTQREKGKMFEGKEEKEKASEVFRGVWDQARAHEGYQELKVVWMKEKKEWLASGGSDMKGGDVKDNPKREESEDLEIKPENDKEVIKVKTESSQSDSKEDSKPRRVGKRKLTVTSPDGKSFKSTKSRRIKQENY